jgi:hypothetical protein
MSFFIAPVPTFFQNQLTSLPFLPLIPLPSPALIQIDIALSQPSVTDLRDSIVLERRIFSRQCSPFFGKTHDDDDDALRYTASYRCDCSVNRPRFQSSSEGGTIMQNNPFYRLFS